jgi:6-phosphofructokinase 1
MRIGVFCSGGDSPGMNACLRAVVRTAVSAGHEVIGFMRGYQGLLDEDFFVDRDGQPHMGLRSVSNIIGRGGTILRSSRSKEFQTEAGQRKAADVLRKQKIDALVPIGGDGTFRGCLALAKVWDGKIVGCPGTIDNDLCGTDYTIGFHTAVATAVDAIDKLRDTAESHERMFLIEVMGRHSGYIALYSAIAGGAEIACLPETATDLPGIICHIAELRKRGKSSIVAVVAEGDEAGGAEQVQAAIAAAGCAFEGRVVNLGHIQRGGSPMVSDRILATRLGDFAVRAILEGKTGVMAGEVGNKPVLVPFEQATAGHNTVPPDLVRLLETMAN